MKRKRWAERHKGLLIMGGTLLTLALAVTGSCQYYMQPQYAGEVVYDRLWSTILYSVVKLYTFSPTVNIGIRTPLCYEIARWAAPLASLLVEKYLNGEIGENRKALEKRILEGNLMDKVKTD